MRPKLYRRNTNSINMLIHMNKTITKYDLIQIKRKIDEEQRIKEEWNLYD
jgi:hypothetical protein